MTISPATKFEAGTPNIAGGIALGSAIDFVKFHRVEGKKRKKSHDMKAICGNTQTADSQIPGVRLIGRPATKAVVSFICG